MTDSQEKVLRWLRAHPGWHRPAGIQPEDYPGSASSVGRVLATLVDVGLVAVRQGDRGNGTKCKEYSAK